MKKEPNEPAPKTDPVPPPKGWAAIWKHLQNWQSIYLFLPLSMLAIWGFAEGAYFVTGRRPTENVDWIVGTAGNLVKLVFLVVWCEIFHQQNGIWWTREQQLENPQIVWIQTLGTSVVLCVGAYILQH